MTKKKQLATATLCLLASIAGPLNARASDPITVQLRSGRVFMAFLDDRTNDNHLWLRFEGNAMLVWRPIVWGRVVEVTYQGQSITVKRLKELAPSIKTSRRLSPGVPKATRPSPRPLPETKLTGDRPVRSLDIEASIANWDADSEIDGLRLHVAPLGARGEIVPVTATLEVTLLGVRPASLPAKYAFPRGNPFPRVGYWTRQITLGTVERSGVTVDLPFQAKHPARDFDLGSYGTVIARLHVPGHGVFEATDDLVRIRPYGSIRNAY